MAATGQSISDAGRPIFDGGAPSPNISAPPGTDGEPILSV
jgi:hypothetical protein